MSIEHPSMNKVEKKSPSAWRRVGSYALGRIFTISLTIVVGVFITVVMANKNKGIDISVSNMLYYIAQREAWDSVNYSAQSSVEIQQMIAERLVELEQEAGLYDPFLIKHIRWTWNALQLRVGDTVYTNTSVVDASTQDRHSISLVILDRLPNTLAIIGTADLLVFGLGIPLALYLSRKYGTWYDKLLNILSPLSSVPSWVLGILLIIVFGLTFKVLPAGGMIDVPLPETRPAYLLSRLKHMVLPVTAVFVNLLFQLVYSWRNFFMIYSNEDYVEFGVAQGLPWRKIQNKYILRPALPYVLTSFALTLVSFWQMTIALEVVFDWDGIGILYIYSLPNFLGDNMFPGEMGLTVGIVVLFAYFLGVVVFILDIAYALVDPRIRLGSNNERIRANRSPNVWSLGKFVDRFLLSRDRAARNIVFTAAFFLFIGGVVGLFSGRHNWLSQKDKSTPANLSNAFQFDYIEMAIESFFQDQNSELLRKRFEALGSRGGQVFKDLIQTKMDDRDFTGMLDFLVQNYDYADDTSDILAEPDQAGKTSWLPVGFLGSMGLAAAAGGIFVITVWKRRRLTRLHLTLVSGGFLLLGIMAGLVGFYQLWPLNFTEVSPAELQFEYQVDYVCMVINSYNQNFEPDLVHTRLGAMEEDAKPAVKFVYENSFLAGVSQVNILRFSQEFKEYTPEDEYLAQITRPATESVKTQDIEKANPLSLVDMGLILVMALMWGVIILLVRQIRSPESESIFNIWRRQWKAFGRVVRGMAQYPSAVVGMVILGLMVVGSVYVVIRYPYNNVGEGWYTDTSKVSKYVPRMAKPKWVNALRKQELAETIVIDSRLEPNLKIEEPREDGGKRIFLTYTFDFPYQDFPSEAIIFFDADYDAKRPFIFFSWVTPDGREFTLDNYSIEPSNYLNLEDVINPRHLGEYQVQFLTSTSNTIQDKVPLLNALFMDPQSDPPQVVTGTYSLEMEVLTFEPGSDVDVELVLLGNVYGLAGTDVMRRDLVIPLLWGMPFALLFGLLGALLTSFVSMTLAAVGVWFGGWVERIVQWVTEANMVLPVVAIAVLFYAFYGLDMWIVLLIIVVLNAFGSPIKTFRAAFIQVKEASYIEAAQAYGATNSRIIFRYMVPRILPVLIPQLVTLVPSYIFLEATLGILKVESVLTPTWGKVIHDALAHSAIYGSKFWVMEPIALLLLTGFAFSMMGAALERVLNPRLLEGD